MKLVLRDKYSHLRTFIESLPDIFDKEGESIFLARNEIRLYDEGGFTLNVKSYKVPILINRIAYTFFRPSKASRAYEHALTLLSKGFQTPDPVAYIETKKNGLLHRSFFISLHTPMDGHMRLFNDEDKDNVGKEDLIKAFAEFTARLHEADILHCDYSPGNILREKVDEMGKISYNFSLVDINRMQFRPVSVKMGCKNFRRMRGNDEFFRLCATYYAKERGADVEQCVQSFLDWKYKDRAKRKRKERFKEFTRKIFK